MQVITLLLIGLGFASITIAQNDNDPLILNVRSGLTPVIYDGFTTFYASTHAPARHGVSVSLTPTPNHSHKLTKTTTSMQCWRNGYPCGRQRSQRHAAEFARAASGLAHRPPPPAFFSTCTEVPFPDHTKISNECYDDFTSTLPLPMDNLPITTSLLGGEPCDTPPTVTSSEGELTSRITKQPIRTTSANNPVDILPIPTSFLGGKPCGPRPPGCSKYDNCYHIQPCPYPTKQPDAPYPSETGEDTVSVMPISSSSSVNAPCPTCTEGDNTHALSFLWPTERQTRTAIPTSWWRGPKGTGNRTKWWSGPDLTHSRHHTSAVQSHTMHRSRMPTVLPIPTSSIETPLEAQPTLTPITSLQFSFPPQPTIILESPCTIAPRRKGPYAKSPSDEAVPIDWWRGPGQLLSPNAPGPVQRESSIYVSPTVYVPSEIPSAYSTVVVGSTDKASRYFCPSWASTTWEKPTSTMLKLVTTTHTVIEPIS
ncbi:hypothetical protein SVAN01_08703 [Stagonosporopsis vannaccii]|nr:hypothetical protein SVAN01_08703 [Stagonosporopsis vannaccii]